MHVTVDTRPLDSFLTAVARVRNADADALAAWVEYEQLHPQLFARYYERWGKPEARSVAAEAMIQTAEQIETSGRDWHRLLDEVAKRLTPMLPGDVDIPVVVLVGTRTSNGWVTPLAGRTRVFFAAEVAATPPFDAILAAHELTHAAQDAFAGGWKTSELHVGAHVFAEGLAAYVSALSYPGHAEDEYLWFDGSHRPWLRECEQAWTGAVPQLLSVLHTPCRGAIYQRLFATPPNGDGWGVPKRFGYYAGWRVVNELATEMRADEMFNVDLATAQRLVRTCLERRGDYGV